MDEIKSKLNDWFQLGNELKEYDKVIDNFLHELERQSLVSHLVVEKALKLPKKKRNMLSPLIEGDDIDSITKTSLNKISLNPLEATAKVEASKIVSSTEIKIEVLSNEDKDKMPPPSQPPLKTKKMTKPSKTSSVDKIIPTTEIKQEKSETTVTMCEPLMSNTRPKRTISQGKRNTNTSHECDVIQNPAEETVNKCSVVLIKISACDIDSIKSSGIQLLDSENANNITFEMNTAGIADPENTFIIEKEKPDTAFVVPKMNETVIIGNQKEDQSKPSLSTENDSKSEETNIKDPKIADKNEICGQNIESPGRKKFQRCNKLQSPTAACITRNKKQARDISTPWGAGTLPLVAEDKKRKRVEKQKQAQQNRETNERKKREDVERLAHEKAEKSKNLLHAREIREHDEYEKKKILRDNKLQKANLQRNLEEIQKNLEIPKYLEKKRDGHILRVLQNAKLADIKENDSFSVPKTTDKRDEHQIQYDFHLLLSGDSTDDEDKQDINKPSPPAWSLATVREPVIRQQNYIQLKTVDKLFAVQPMTIDLQEIFPTIDSRYLVRNSSVIWSSPQQYAELPKY